MYWTPEPLAAHSLLACCCLRATSRSRDLRSRMCTSAVGKGQGRDLGVRGAAVQQTKARSGTALRQAGRVGCKLQLAGHVMHTAVHPRCSGAGPLVEAGPARAQQPNAKQRPPTVIVRGALLSQALQPGLQASVRRQQLCHGGTLLGTAVGTCIHHPAGIELLQT